MAQALVNMLNNSNDEVGGKEGAWIAIRTSIMGGNLVIRFSDSGPGIPKEVAAQIFTPFFTTKEIGKGTGLGMSITHSIVAEHGGTIAIDERAPTTTFVITLPLQRAAPLAKTG